MRPVRLEMIGFGAFREPTTVDFTDVDLVALVGATGSGKSTVIDAITFALYGSVARYADKRAVAPVINQLSNEARVSLAFELSDESYTAIRVVRRTKTGATTKEARLERGDDPLAGDADAMTEEVTTLLGLNFDQFNRTVVLPQGRFAEFIHARPADRQATLLHLLGLDTYRRMGRAARAREESCRAQLEVLQPGLTEADELTDDKRLELEQRIARIAAASEFVATNRENHAAVEASIRDVGIRLDKVEGARELLADVAAPAGIDDLDRTVATAEAVRRTAAGKLINERRARNAAVDKVRAGPNITTVKLQLKDHDAAAQLTAGHQRIGAQLAEATQVWEGAAASADQVRTTQRQLDDQVEAARQAEEDARLALAAVPSTEQIDHRLQLHSRLQEQSRAVEEAENQVVQLSAAVDALDVSVSAAREAEAEARTRCDEVRRRAGASGFIDLLKVGVPCPLCLQEVHEVPDHHVDEEVQAAERLVTKASARLRVEEEKRDVARSEQMRVRAKVEACCETVEKARAELAGVPSVETLIAQRAETERRSAALKKADVATKAAVNAAAIHRDSPDNARSLRTAEEARDRVTQLTTSAAHVGEQLAELDRRLGGMPGVDELNLQLAEAERLQAERVRADADLAEAENADEAARIAVDDASRSAQEASQALHSARDRVAALGPPIVAGLSIAAGWSALCEWAAAERDALVSRRAVLTAQHSDLSAERERLEHVVRDCCNDVLGDIVAALTLSELAHLLTRRAAEADNDLNSFDERLARLRKLQHQLADLNEQVEVADMLGNLLRADGFERWLMHAALEQLVDGATQRLSELSGGQYSLELDDSSFAVRDHANADELRSARTLSGGETFLASLSLALALADTTAELAPEGAPQIESIFLDEGFGTLDADTLDTVATSIEELSANGRLVGIVTHIHELADRMPVRLEVTKTGGTATVERIET